MAHNLGKANIEVEIDLAELQSNLDSAYDAVFKVIGQIQESFNIKPDMDLSKVDKGLKDTAESSKVLKTSFKETMEIMQSMTVAAYGITNVMKNMSRQIGDVVMTAARVETLDVVVHQLGKTVGLSADEIDNYVKSVEEMGITSEVARNTIAKMIQAQVDLSKSSELARLSQHAAIIANINSSEALDRLIHGITTYNPIVIRSMGITVTFQRAMQEYAKSVGKTTNELTDLERIQVATNEVLRKGETIAGTYEAAMDTAGKKIGSFSRYTEEAKVSLGDVFLPVAELAIDTMTDLTRAFTESEKPIQVLVGGVALIGSNLLDLLPAIAAVKTAFGTAWIAVLGKAGAAVAILAIQIAVVVDSINNIIEAIKHIPTGGVGFKPTLMFQGGDEEETRPLKMPWDPYQSGRLKMFYDEEEKKKKKEITTTTTPTSTKGRTGKTEGVTEVLEEELDLLGDITEEYEHKLHMNEEGVQKQLEILQAYQKVLEKLLETTEEEKKRMELDEKILDLKREQVSITEELTEKERKAQEEKRIAQEEAEKKLKEEIAIRVEGENELQRLQLQNEGDMTALEVFNIQVKYQKDMEYIKETYKNEELKEKLLNAKKTAMRRELAKAEFEYGWVMMTTLQTTFTSLTQRIQGAFSDMWTSIFGDAHSLLEIFVSTFISELIKIASMKVFTTILNFLAPGVGSILEVIGGAFGARAEGGPVYAGQSYITGEEGPEWFMPTMDGYIFNADDFKGLMDMNSLIGGRLADLQDLRSMSVELPSIDIPSMTAGSGVTNVIGGGDVNVNIQNQKLTGLSKQELIDLVDNELLPEIREGIIRTGVELINE